MSLPLLIGLRYTGAKRKSRSVSFLSGVSVTGLAVGVSLLILVLSVMNGFDRELKRRILSLVPQAAVYERGGMKDWRFIQKEVGKAKEVVGAAPFIELSGLVSFGAESVFVSLFGFSPPAEAKVSRVNEFVSTATLAKINRGEPIILLGKGVADQLKVDVGDTLMVVVPDGRDPGAQPNIAYLSVGEVLETSTELDSNLALTSLEMAAELADLGERVTGLRIKLRDLFLAPAVMYELNVSLGRDFYTSNWTRTHWNLYQAIQMSKNMVALLMTLIVAIAAFNVVSTLVLVVVDKQSDIAILRTLGASNVQIMGVFIVQGSTIALLGTMLGVILGCGIALMVEDFVVLIENLFSVQFLQSDVYPLTYLPTEIRGSDIFSVVSTALGMSLLATLYPAWRASRVQPAEALRYE